MHGRYLGAAVALIAAAPRLAVAEPETMEQRRAAIVYTEAPLGGEFLDVDVDWYPRSTVHVFGDILASAGEHTIRAPAVWTLHYDPSKVKPGGTVRMRLNAYTESDPTRALQKATAGWESTIGIGVRKLFGWLEFSWGLDIGFDIEDFGLPPMAGQSSEGRDTVQTGLWVPPGPPGVVPTLAEVLVEIGVRIREGQLIARLSANGGSLFDCQGNPYTGFEVAWFSPETQNCLDLVVQSNLGSGDTVELTVTGLGYYVGTGLPLGLVGSLLGRRSPTLPLGTLPTASLRAVSGETLSFALPVRGQPADLIAGHIALSSDPRALWPTEPFSIHGQVVNGSDTATVTTASIAEIAISPAGVGAFTVHHAEDVNPLGTSEARYVTARIEGGLLPPGEYDVRLQVDANDAIVEASETNNFVFRRITVADIPPDLFPVAGSLSVTPDRPHVNQGFTVSVGVANDAASTVAAEGFDVGVEIFDPGTNLWTSLGSTSVASLASGAMQAVAIPVPVPSQANLPEPGFYVLRVHLDPGKAVAERRESNNLAYGGLYLRDLGPELFAEITDLYFSSTPSPPIESTSVIAWLNVRNGGATDALGIDVDFYKVGGTQAVPIRIPIGSALASTIRAGADRQVAVQFYPEDVDPAEPAGAWMVEAVIETADGEANTDNNVVQRELFIGPAVGSLELAVRDAAGAHVAAADVSLAVDGRSITTGASDVPGSVNPRVNALVRDVAEGAETVTIGKSGYQPVTRDVEIHAGHPTYLSVLLEAEAGPDLTGEVVPVPPTPAPGGLVGLLTRIRNAGGSPLPPGTDVVVGVYLNHDRIAQLVIDAPLAPGEAIEVPVPGGPFPLPPGQDSYVEVVVDEPGVIPEESEGNNVDGEIVTNPKPVVTIDSVAPDPAVFGQAVSLSGGAVDVSGQVLAYEWISDRDGLVARTPVASVSSLSVGTHRLTLRARDERDETASATSTVSVTDGRGPSIFLRHAPGSVLMAPASPRFAWAGSDDVSHPRALSYSYYLDGLEPGFAEFGPARETVYLELAPGDYVFRLRGRDEAGNVSSPVESSFTVIAPEAAGDGGGCGCRTAGGSWLAWMAVTLALLIWRGRGARRPVS